MSPSCRHLAAVFLACSVAGVPAARADVPLVVSHHGRLVDGGDQPVSGELDVTVRIYRRLVDNPGEDNLVWQETYEGVTFTNGLYALLVGDPEAGRPLLLEDWSGAEGRWFTVQVGDQPELLPRLAIASVPYAFRAGDADTVGGLAPSAFAPAEHGHDVADVAGLEAFVEGAAGALADDNPRHHARFTADEARTAMGAASNDNPLHHARYTAEEARAAMGAEGDDNPLHHARYTAEEARAAMGAAADDNPLHHARFTGPEAVEAVTASGAFAAASHAHDLADLTDFRTAAPGALAGLQVGGDFSVAGRFGAGTASPRAKVHADARFVTTRYPGASWTQFGLVAFNAGRVNDGDNATPAFHTDSSGAGSYLALDLGAGEAKEFVRALVYTSGNANQTIAAVWDVEYSDDGSTWTKAYTRFGPFIAPPASQPRTALWTNVGPHRFWRLLKTNAAQAGGYHAEVQFLERPALIEGSTESGTRFLVDNNGNTRVSGSLRVETDVWTPFYYQTNYAVSTTVTAPLLDQGGEPIPQNFVAQVNCSVVSTSAPGASIWLVKRWPNDRVDIERIASFNFTSSNTPELFDDGGVVTLRLYAHDQVYGVRCTTFRM